MNKKIQLRRLTLIMTLVLLTSCKSTPRQDDDTGQADLEHIIQLANAGFDDAQHTLCYRYKYGYDGAQKNHEEAFKWCEKQAHRGNNSSQTLLAELYFKGQFVAEDHQKAVYWYKRAAEQGHDFAMYMLYYMYRYEYKSVYDPIQASYWLSQAKAYGQKSALKAKPINVMNCGSLDTTVSNAGTYLVNEDKTWVFNDTVEAITLKLGANFGIKSTFMTNNPLNPDAQNLLPIKVKWTHPPLVNPETNSDYRSTPYWSSQYFTTNKKELMAGYNMTNAWEMVPGLWKVELFCDAQVIATHSFELVD